jgi:hypothetical protein
MLMAATFLVMAGAAAPAAPAASLPADIERHYAEYNVVTAFSTPHERYRIAEGTAARDDPRLARVARLMDRLQERVDEVDPGMVTLLGQKGRETVFRSDLLRVVSWRTSRSGDEGWATLDVSALEGSTGALLVGQFDALAGPDRLPAVDTLLSFAKRTTHSTEVHHWRRVGGEWRRDAATVHFIAN